MSFADEAETRDPRQYFFTQSFGDLPEEMQIARDAGKIGMLLFFETEDCPYCHLMLKNVLSRPRVQDWYQERFVSIAIDIRGDLELKDFDGITLPSKVFAEHRRIFVTPIISILNLDGIEIYRHIGMIKTPEEFLLLGRYIEEHHYFDTEYEVFLKSEGLGESDEVLTTPAASGDAM